MLFFAISLDRLVAAIFFALVEISARAEQLVRQEHAYGGFRTLSFFGARGIARSLLGLPLNSFEPKVFSMLSRDVCEQARLARDPEFDGRFFTAVKTTGIYCRPVCPVKQPLSRNVTYYETAAAAEAAGYRPCLRCRPETAPFCPAWNGTKSTVARAIKLIESGALDSGSVEQLSLKLGISSRHLGRLFSKHLSVSPLQFARTCRLRRAKLLLNDTTLSIAEVIERSGFKSRRQFNETFLRTYNRTPTSLRRTSRTGAIFLTNIAE